MRRYLIYSFLTLNIALTTYAWWVHSGGLFGTAAGNYIALGRLAGLYLELSIMLMIILMGRIRFIETAFGHDKMNRLHRIMGYSVGAFLLAHPTLLVLGYSHSEGWGWWSQLMDFLTNWEDVFDGLLGASLLVAMVIFSLPWIRRQMKYGHWHAIHLLAYPAFVLFIGHQTNTGDMAGSVWTLYWYALNFGGMGIFALYRFGLPALNLGRRRFRVERLAEEASGAVSIYITGKDMDKFKFHAGQFANFMFLDRRLWTPHPFSFSAAPNGKNIRITAKPAGDFTGQLKHLLPGTPVIIDGPLGRFTERAAKKDKFLLLAGGVGITPIRAMAEEFSLKNRNVILLYANKTTKDIIFEEELRSMAHKYHFLLTEVAEFPESGYEKGRIDEEKIRRLAPDFAERDTYICGPAAMIKDLTGLLGKMGVPKAQIHSELFSY